MGIGLHGIIGIIIARAIPNIIVMVDMKDLTINCSFSLTTE